MGNKLTVRRAERSDFEVLVTTLREAVPDEAVTDWIMRGYPLDRFLDAYVPEIVERGLTEDEIWVAGAAGEIWAISVWQTVHSVERLIAEAAAAREQADHAPGVRPLQRSAQLTELLAREHPRWFPHHYLELMVTLGRHRGLGAGAAILGTRMREFAAMGRTAYLEASTERSARLYARHGFGRMRATHTLPENGPTLVPMWFAP